MGFTFDTPAVDEFEETLSFRKDVPASTAPSSSQPTRQCRA